MNKITLQLHPCSGSVKEKECYRATVETGRGNVMGIDSIVEYAFDRGYIYGIKKEAVKSVVRGLFDSIIDGIREDGRTRRIDDYLSVSLKVHGRFEDAQDEFDPERHKFSLSLAPLNAFRPSFDGVNATNPNHKRQFRLYSVKAADVEGCKNHTVVWKRDVVIKGAEFPLDDSLVVNMFVKHKDDHKRLVSVEPAIVSRSDTELRLAWPDEFMDEAYSKGRMGIRVTKIIDVTNPRDGIKRREIKAQIIPEEAE